MKTKIFGLLIVISIVIRLVLSLTTYHSDLGAFALAGKYIAGQGKWLTFYDTIASKDETGKMVVHRTDMVFNYQPLAYLIPSVFYLPFSSIVKETGELLINRNWLVLNGEEVNFLLLLYKLPMITADLAILFFISRLFIKESNKKNAMLLWAFNPLAIYVSSVMGQVDIIIALFVFVCLWAIKEKRYYLAVVAIATSALIKPVGLILLPIIALGYLAQSRNIVKTGKLLVLGVAVYMVGILPYISSASYRYYALFAEQINKSTYAAISIAAGTDIPYFFILLSLVILLVWKKSITINTAIGLGLLASLVFTHFHPQWLVWLMPWLVVRTVNNNDYLVYIAMIFCWFGVLISFDETLHLQTFIHSQMVIPEVVRKSNIFIQYIQMCRAGLIGLTLTFLK